MSEKMGDRKIPKGNVNKWILAAAGFLVIAATVIGLMIYNSPQNRQERLLRLGHTHLDNGEYEEAIVVFEKVIAIDEKCVEAYAGAVDAYIHTEDTEGMTAFYDRALEAVDGWETEVIEENIDHVSAIYLAADNIYSEEPERVIAVLEKGYQVTEGETQLKERLVDDYFLMAQEYTENGTYVDSLDVYDKLKELDADEALIEEGMQENLQAYIMFLLEEEQYAEIGEVVQQYEEVGQSVIDGVVENFLHEVQTYAEVYDFEAGLSVYDILLQFAEDNVEVQNSLADFLTDYIAILIEEKRYDEIRELVETYKDKAKDMDFEAVLKSVEENEAEDARLEAERIAEEERLAREAAEKAQSTGTDKKGYKDSDIPDWIRHGEIKMPFGAWSEADAKKYRQMWEQYWGDAYPWPFPVGQ